MRGVYCGVPGADGAGVANADDGIEREGGVATEGADAEGKAGGGAAGDAAGGGAAGDAAGGGAGGGFRFKLCALMTRPRSGLSLIIFII